MPSYLAPPLQPVQIHALYPGNQIALVNNAATDTGVTTTMQFVVGSIAGQQQRVTFVNLTNQAGQLNFAATDALLNYEPVSGGAVGAAQSSVLNLSPGYYNVTFAAAPISGSFIAAA